MTAIIIIAVIAVVIVVLALILFGMYNGLIRSRNRVKEAWSGIDVQLRRRASLVPNLVETVKGYASHERETFEEVTRARSAVEQAGSIPDAAEIGRASCRERREMRAEGVRVKKEKKAVRRGV